MSTILTDDEMIAAVGAPAYLAAGRAVEAAVLAKLAQQEHLKDLVERRLMYAYPIAEQAAAPEAPAQCREPSPTAGMNMAQRILHVGGRNNAAGYVEFGSIQAVEALVRHVLRDLPDAPPAQNDPMDTPLPCDVRIGNGIHSKGTSLRTLVNRAQRLHEAAFGPAPTKEEAAANLEQLRSAVIAPAQASAVDERAAFEAWWDLNGLGPIDFQWEAWQARAALAQKGGAA